MSLLEKKRQPQLAVDWSAATLTDALHGVIEPLLTGQNITYASVLRSDTTAFILRLFKRAGGAGKHRISSCFTLKYSHETNMVHFEIPNCVRLGDQDGINAQQTLFTYLTIVLAVNRRGIETNFLPSTLHLYEGGGVKPDYISAFECLGIPKDKLEPGQAVKIAREGFADEKFFDWLTGKFGRARKDKTVHVQISVLLTNAEVVQIMRDSGLLINKHNRRSGFRLESE